MNITILPASWTPYLLSVLRFVGRFFGTKAWVRSAVDMLAHSVSGSAE